MKISSQKLTAYLIATWVVLCGLYIGLYLPSLYGYLPATFNNLSDIPLCFFPMNIFLLLLWKGIDLIWMLLLTEIVSIAFVLFLVRSRLVGRTPWWALAAGYLLCSVPGFIIYSQYH